MIRAWSIFLVTVFISGFGNSQDLDSLIFVAEDDKLADSIRGKLYADIAWELRDVRPDSALLYATLALEIAEDDHNYRLITKSINYQGVAYRNLGLYSKSLIKYLEALKRSEEYSDYDQRGYALINIANLHIFQKDFSEAQSYLEQALEQAKELNNSNMMGYAYVNLGRVNRELGSYNEALVFFGQAERERSKINDVYGLIAIEIDKAKVLRLSGEIDQSLSMFINLVDRTKEINDMRALVSVYVEIAKIYLLKDDFQNGEIIAREAIEIARNLSLKYEEKEALGILSKIHASREDYFHAYELQIQYDSLNYQLFSEEKIRQIEQLMNQAYIESQEAENRLLRIQKDRQLAITYSLAIISILILIAAILAYRAFVIKKRLSEEIKNQRDKIQNDKKVIEKQSHKLRRLDAAKSIFFANVSHDLRAPLGIILTSTDFLNQDEDSTFSEQARMYMEFCLKSANQLVYLTEEINDIARIQEGKIQIDKQNVQIVVFIRELTDMFRSTAEHKGVSLTFETKMADSKVARIDPRQFEKVYYNLISNAIRHSMSGEHVTVSINEMKGFLKIIFEDTGEGIPQEALPYIFERFYQSETDNYKPKGGLGIGLALVKELVELHQGTIEVHSEVGVGSKFTITLPYEVQEVGFETSPSKYIKAMTR